MAGKTMVERGRVERVQHRRGRTDHETVQQHRGASDARGKDRARHGGNFTPAKTRQNFKRVRNVRPVALDRGAHGGGLARKALVVNAGPAADPILRPPAVERVKNRCRDGRIADAHFAQDQKVRLGGKRLHAESHRRRAHLLVERGF